MVPKVTSVCQTDQKNATIFFRLINDTPQPKFASIINPDCPKIQEKIVSTIDLSISTNDAIRYSDHNHKLIVKIGPKTINYFDFVKNGFRIERGEEKDVRELVEARVIKLNPQKEDDSWFSIDNEEYEVKAIKITLLPKLINIFCNSSSTLENK